MVIWITLLIFICMVYVNFGDAGTVHNFLLYGGNNVIATIVVDICKKKDLDHFQTPEREHDQGSAHIAGV